MPLAVRTRPGSESNLPALPGLLIEREFDAQFMAALQSRPVADMQRRLQEGHRAYVARLHGVPAAWGWVATRSAEIGELKATMRIPARDRYLWNFVTLAEYRGLGIYPRLLTAIMSAEQGAERFWIAYAPENRASGTGIHKAGFVTLAELSFDAGGSPAVKPLTPDGGAQAGQLLGLPIVDHNLAPCWRCTRTVGPAEAPCGSAACCCDYQKPERRCA